MEIIYMKVKDSKCVMCICGENIFSCHFPRTWRVPFPILIVSYKALSRLSKEEFKQSISCLPCHLESLAGMCSHKLCIERGQGLGLHSLGIDC